MLKVHNPAPRFYQSDMEVLDYLMTPTCTFLNRAGAAP